MKESDRVDPRLNAYLDGELHGQEAADFEGDLQPGSALWNQLETLMQLGAWFQATRPRAPTSLARSVELALERELAARRSGWISRRPGWFSRPRGLGRWIWAPAALVAGLLVFLFVSDSRGPSNLLSPPLEKQAATHTPPPAIQTSRTVTSALPRPNTVRYVFTVKADRAREICLAGDFNQWKVCDAPLLRVREGVWSITIDLPRGRHEYMFVIDGQWVTDPNAMGYSKDGFGNRNALLVV